MAGNHSDDLPDILELDLETLETYWGKWVIWRATDRRFLPSQLSREQELELNTLLQCDDLFERISRQIAKQENEQQTEGNGDIPGME